MGNDVHYIIIFTVFFLILGLLVPLLNAEIGTDYSGNEFELEDDPESYGSLTMWQMIGNILLVPFWTFGFPAWINIWILLPLRIPFIFVIARNIWVGGGG